MPRIRNVSKLDLMDRFHRVYPAGEVVEVDEEMAARLLTNPNFVPVKTPAKAAAESADSPTVDRPRKAGKKD